MGFIDGLLAGDRFVEVEEEAAEAGVRGVLGGVQLLTMGGFANGQQLSGGGWVGGVLGFQAVEASLQDLALGGSGSPR